MLDFRKDDDCISRMMAFDKPLTDKPQESFTLPSCLYTDPRVYEVEKERIFYRTWQFVAHESVFPKPGDYVTLRICDQNIFVIRGQDGCPRAFYNVCQHRAHELLPDGRGNVSRAIVCPYHAWVFETDGRLRGAPRSDRRPDFRRDDYALKPIRLEMFLGCAFVNLDSDAKPLSAVAGDLEADIRRRLPFLPRLAKVRVNGLGETRIEAGWKVVVDNYVECYHCDHAHPAFADIICMDSYRHDTFGLWSRQLGEDIRLKNSAYRVDADCEFKQSAFWFLWPNTTFNVLPGSGEINISAIRPTGLETTSFEGYTLSSEEEFDEARAEYTANVLVPEDIDLCESVQRGLKSRGYSQGPMIVDPERSGRGEHAIHHFHRLVQQALG
ncbi:MAG: aromatic ring-hydroxylating dioxygenase subunit alpha [Paracoccaceae bacterium]|nr:aromatic ring-hydroxylating dioxygenase subunit alpha [Paracoccaceae bacterium]MDE2911389.1 aromatic ring-hydroxylating dioxygenase subunit alpha [Paracoccaceae bacterium]